MNNNFINDLLYNMSRSTDYVFSCAQSDIKDMIEPSKDQFPMVCFEFTGDCDFEVELNESKFLNDPIHDGTWVIGSSDVVNFVVNLKEMTNHRLEIDVLEVNTLLRSSGVGREVVEIIEDTASKYFKEILISPFDTDAINFWEHMEYIEYKNGFWRKIL